MARGEIVFLSATGLIVGLCFAGLHFRFVTVLVFAFAGGLTVLLARRGVLAAFCLFFVSLILGFGYYGVYWNAREKNERLPSSTETFSFVVKSEPSIYGDWQLFNAELLLPFKGIIRVRTLQRFHIAYGDQITTKGTLFPKRTEREQAFLNIQNFEITGKNQGSKLLGSLISFKQKVANSFRTALPQEKAALLSGLTFGIRNDFTPTFQEEMRRSGTTHLVALSGYNIAVLIIAIEAFFGNLLSRNLKFVCIGITLIFFVLMVGAEASIVRAAIMGALILIAKELGRPHIIRNIIAISALVMALINPAVIFELGFLLSFTSLIGIVAADALFGSKDESASKGTLEWRESLRTTISAQVAVAPLLIGSFGMVSLFSLFSNILILPFVPLAMLTGFLLGGVTPIAQGLGFFFALFVKLILGFMIGVIRFFSSHALLINASVNPFFFAISYYALLAFVIYYVRLRKKA